eukprot:gene12257-5842_t
MNSLNEEVDKFSETLPIKDILKNPSYFQIYYEFCKKERNAEALDFYKSVKVYETLETEEERLSHAKSLYNNYIDENASDSLNINSSKRDEVKKQLEKPTEQLFESIKEEVEILTLDPYRRFFKTVQYEHMVVQQEIENKLKISENEQQTSYIMAPGIALRAISSITKNEVLLNDAYEALEYLTKKKIILEGKAKKKGGPFLDFKVTTKGKLYYIDLLKNTCEFHDLVSADFNFTRVISEKEPFSIQLGDEIVVSFDKGKTYQKFIEILKYFGHEEITPHFSCYSSRLEGVEIDKWDSLHVLEFLSTIFDGNFCFSEYENYFAEPQFTGKELKDFSVEELKEIKLTEPHAKLLKEEIQKVIKKGYNNSVAKISLKIDCLPDRNPENIQQFTHEFLLSLGNSTNILDSYLNLSPIQKLHKDIYEYENSQKSISVKLILTQMIHNHKRNGFETSFSGTISKYPKFEKKDKFDNFIAAVIIGPFYLEFSENSLCVPKRISKTMYQLYETIPDFTVLKKKNFNEVVSKLSKFIADWNVNYQFVAHEPNFKKKEGNHCLFVEELLKLFKISLKYRGSLGTFMMEMREHGDSGASIYPTEYVVEFEKKFGFSFIPKIEYHDEFDEQLITIFERETKFRSKYPHDFLVFQAIDLGFWIKHHHSPEHQEFIPLFDENKKISKTSFSAKPICPCYAQILFESIDHGKVLKKSSNSKKSIVFGKDVWVDEKEEEELIEDEEKIEIDDEKPKTLSTKLSSIFGKSGKKRRTFSTKFSGLFSPRLGGSNENAAIVQKKINEINKVK